MSIAQQLEIIRLRRLLWWTQFLSGIAILLLMVFCTYIVAEMP